MKLSIHMLAYNHEKYIAQAIDSVLMQQVHFPYELVIGEDCSTDDTRNIVKKYKEKYPDIIRLLLHEKNIGMMMNSKQTRELCSGEYIAELEGDDYWTSPKKLQMQVDFLDSHPDFSICFHPVLINYDGMSGKDNHIYPDNIKEVYTLEDLLENNFIPTCSVMYRNYLINEFPDWFYKLKMGDWPLNILNARHGKIKYINNVMGVYRVHPTGVWSSLNKTSVLEGNIEAYNCINSHFNYKYGRIIYNKLSDSYYKLALLCEENKIFNSARKYILNSISCSLYSKKLPHVGVYKLFFRVYLPSSFRLYSAIRKLIN